MERTRTTGGSPITIDRPWALVLLVLAGAAVWLTVRGRGYSRGRLIFLAAVRLALASCAVLAVAGIAVRLPAARRHVVFLVDRSPGFADRAASADALVAERRRTLPAGDAVTVLYFDRRASPAPSPRPEDATDLEAALDAGSAAIPPGHPGVIFLLTDGIETTGDASQAALRLAARGIPVFVPRPSSEVPPDVRISLYEAPPMVPPYQRFTVVWRIDSTRPMSAEVRSGRGGGFDLIQHVKVAPDVPAFVRYETSLIREGVCVFEARVTADGDRFPQNNSATAPVSVLAKPLIVYLSAYVGETPAARYLSGSGAFRFRRLASAGELTPEVLSDASVVVLDNFPAAMLGARSADVASFVRDAGGGLIMIGGPASFGSGGYIDTAIDAVLPVHCDPRDADKKPLALVVLLDSSGSMGEGGGEKMEIARAAAARTLGRLTAKDSAAVLAFRVTAEVVVPLGPVADPRALARTLAGITPTGGTNIFPALDRALALLAQSKAPLKHVILLSDGKSLPGDADAVLSRYAKAGVTLSAMATGKDTDRLLLGRLSGGTGGRFYEAADVRTLADLFLDDLRRIDGPLVREGVLQVEPADTGDLLKDILLERLPTVAAYNRTRARDGATVALCHVVEGTPEPLLAVRRSGLGRSAALMLSFEESWVGAFTQWNGWMAVIARILRDTHRVEPVDAYGLSIRREGGDFDATVVLGPTLVGSALPKLTLRLTDASGATADVPVRRATSRTCRAEARTRMEGVVTATLLGGDGPDTAPLRTAYVPTACPREFREFVPRVDLLEKVARITGGALVDNLDRFRVAGGRAARESRDATAWLVAFALALFLVELIGRATGRL